MLSRIGRINRELFTTLLKSGVVVGFSGGELLSAKSYLLPKANKASTLLSVVVGTKIAKKAVTRNRLKRRIRAIIYKHQAEMASQVGIIIWVKSVKLATDPFSLVEKEILMILKKLKVIKTTNNQ